MAATSIESPDSGLGAIQNIFGNIHSMFGTTGSQGGATSGSTGFPQGSAFGAPLTGGYGSIPYGSGPYGVTPQPVSGSDNSLTAMFRSLSNLLGTSAPSFLQAGSNLVGTGMGVTQGGLDVTGQALGTLQTPIDFYNKLLSGDPSTVTAALAPTAANLSQIYTGATNQAAQGMPQGGYRAATLAGLPQQQAAQVGNAALALQPMAAQGLAQLGGEQANIGQGIAGTGLGVGGLGTTLTGQGASMLQSAINDMLQKQQINQQQPSPFQSFLGLLSSLGSLGGLGTGIGNVIRAVNG